MITGITEIFPCVEVYHCGHDAGDLVETYKAEADRPWSYVPFYTGVLREGEYCASSFSPMTNVHSSALPKLEKLRKAFWEMNVITEDCVHSHAVMYAKVYTLDTGTTMMWLRGDRFSAPLWPADNFVTTLIAMALSDVVMRLDRHDIEFDVSAGDVVLMPCGFPTILQIKPVEKEAFLTFRYMWPS